MHPRWQMGRIVWAKVADANGISKTRPAVIVTPSDRLGAGQPIDVIAITSRLTDPVPEDHVLLPWHRQGHPRTKLNRRCAAVCTWLAQIAENDIEDVAGIVPSAEMTSILGKIAAAASAP